MDSPPSLSVPDSRVRTDRKYKPIETHAHASDTAYRAWSLIIDWIYSFHMPLFMAISGYLYYHVTARKSGLSYGALLLGKAKRLLGPYVIISTIAFLPKMRLASFAMRPTGVSLSDYARSLFIPWDNAIIFFWFLPTLFCAFSSPRS